MEKKQLHLKSYQFYHAQDGSHLLLELLTDDDLSLALPLSPEDARAMGQSLIEQADLLTNA